MDQPPVSPDPTRRTLLMGGVALGAGALGALTLAAPAEAATYTKSKGAWTVTLNCSTVYGGSGSAIGYSVSSGTWRYTKSVPAVCRGFVGITEWGFVQLTPDGYDVAAFSGAVSSSSSPATSRSKSPAYPNNQVRTKTVNGQSCSWQSFGIALVGVFESASWDQCVGVKQYYMYQPYYNRWLSRTNFGPWLP